MQQASQSLSPSHPPHDCKGRATDDDDDDGKRERMYICLRLLVFCFALRAILPAFLLLRRRERIGGGSGRQKERKGREEGRMGETGIKSESGTPLSSCERE